MAERSTIVADASIVGRWYINSPPFVQEARRVRDDFDYDAIYLEIARRQDCPFIHADGGLRRALAGRFPVEVWIEEYRSP